jgi:glyoxylase-like metal-dependent hydrolase (beta-lactamase superfamily II)
LQKDLLKDTSVYPIRIPTPFAVGDVFCYLIIDDKNVLVDTGQYTDDAFSKIFEGLKDYGLTVRDLDEIWLTHGHPDHFGQAARLAESSGAIVYGHPKERANFAGNDDGELFDTFFQYHNISDDFIRQMVDQLDWLQQFQLPIEPEWIKEGDILSSGELSVTVQHTPGHAPGHVAFRSNQDMIFGGDLLLEHISTNALINFDPDTGRRNRSLLQYRESLKWMRLQNGLVLPGHGKIIEQVSVVADHHLSEHEKRYQKIQQLLQQQSMSLMKLSYQMFPDAIENGAIFLVLSEVLGYLDWGIAKGTIHLNETTMEYKAVTE